MQLINPATMIPSNLAMLQGPGGIAYTCLQVFVILSSYPAEMKQATPYSKFAHTVEQQETKKNDDNTAVSTATTTTTNQQQIQVSSRVGMLIIYTPALLASSLVMFSGIPIFTADINRLTLAGIMCFTHFLKRDLEVLFLHKYSGSTPLATASLIGFFYSIYGWLTTTVATTTPSPMASQVGTVLFVIGILGNFYHHYLLATLRRDNNNNSISSSSNTIQQKQYFAPKGGLFEYVAAPHYLFELVGWLGIAIASEHVNVYLVFGGMTSYLAARAVRQNDWNRNKFNQTEWPTSRRNLIPFIF